MHYCKNLQKIALVGELAYHFGFCHFATLLSSGATLACLFVQKWLCVKFICQ